MSESETATPPAAPCPAALSAPALADSLGLSPESFAALSARMWCPVPERLRKLLRETWSAPAGAFDEETARRRERALLALPLLAVGIVVPGVSTVGLGLDFCVDYLAASEDVAREVRRFVPMTEGQRKLRSVARMRDAARRASVLCDLDDDGARWLPVVRKFGTVAFVAVLEKAERRKKGHGKDKDEKRVRDWAAYFEGMLNKAKPETKGGAE